MLRRMIWFTCATVLCANIAFSQQSPAAAPPRMPSFPVTPNTNLVSPEVHADGTVTFRVWAPDAKDVKLSTEGEESVAGATPDSMKAYAGGRAMSKAADGIWSITVGPYPAGAYRYTFQVDGVSATDPKNAASSESLTQVRSLFVIPGNFSDVKDVPHGDVAIVYYRSKALGQERRMHIYLPPGYEKGQASYPVLYLLHGAETAMIRGPQSAGPTLSWTICWLCQAKPMIIVMPAGHVSQRWT